MKKKMLWRIILILFVCIIIGIGVFTVFIKEDNSDDKHTLKSNDYYTNKQNVVITKNNTTNKNIKVLNDKYVVEVTDSIIYSVKDLNGKTLYKSENGFKGDNDGIDPLFEGGDGNLYFVDGKANNAKYLKVYKLVDGELKSVIDIDIPERVYADGERLSGYFAMIKYVPVWKNFEKFYILGFQINDDYVIDLKGNKYDYPTYNPGSLSAQSDTLVNNTRYVSIVLEEFESQFFQQNVKVGLLDTYENKVVDGIKYDSIAEQINNTFLVRNNDKTGLIDVNNNILIPIEYDEIYVKDDFYALVKDDKMALMDKNYKFITEFFGENMEHELCFGGMTLDALRLGKNYLIMTTKEKNACNNGLEIVYFVKNDGSYKIIDDILDIPKDFYADTVEDDFKIKYNAYRVIGDKLVVFFNSFYKVYDFDMNLLYIDGIVDNFDADDKNYNIKSIGNILILSKKGEENKYIDLSGDTASLNLAQQYKGKIKLFSINDINAYVEGNVIKFYDKDTYINQINIDVSTEICNDNNDIIIGYDYTDFKTYILNKQK